MEPSGESCLKSLVKALYDKYDDAGSQDDGFCQIYIPSGAPGSGSQGSGAETLRIPKGLGMESLGITSTGELGELKELCSHVEELDLSHNLIQDWNEVFLLLDSLPQLYFLNISRNPLVQLTSNDGQRYEKLKKLVLNFTNLTWETIENLLVVFPSLEELYLSGNSYEDIRVNLPAYESLRLLQLTDNKFSDWNCVLNIDKVFPKLSTLILAHNNISTCGSAEHNKSSFTNLRVLNMNNTHISEWDELDKLSAITSVSDIRLASIPISKDISDRKKLMQLLSVHFPQMRLVNGSPVVSDNTNAAEMVYLRHFEHDSIKPARYASLLVKHGPLQQLADVSLEPPFSVALTVSCGDKSEVLHIPFKQKISDLRKSLKSFVGSPRFDLFYQKESCTKFKISPLSNNRHVYSFCFHDGDKLFCMP